jgi:molecular chaperone DnaK
LVNPKSTFYNIKAVIGQKYSQEFVDAAKLRYGTVSGEGDYVHFIDEGGKTYSSAQVTSFVLHRMKETAENNLGAQVPSYERWN